MNISDELYNLNANLSLAIGLKQKLSEDNLFALNKQLGEIIKKIRELEERYDNLVCEYKDYQEKE